MSADIELIMVRLPGNKRPKIVLPPILGNIRVLLGTIYCYDVCAFIQNIFFGIILYLSITFKARFTCRTFHEPNLIHRIKNMKRSASESIRNGYFNLERLRRSFRLIWPGIRLWNGFDSDAELNA